MIPDTTCFKQPHLNNIDLFRDPEMNEIFNKLKIIDNKQIKEYITKVNTLDITNLEDINKLYLEIITKVKQNKEAVKIVKTKKQKKISQIKSLLEQMKQTFAKTLGLLWVADYYLLEKLEDYIDNIQKEKNYKKYIELGEKYQKMINKLAKKIDVASLFQKEILNLLDKKEIIFKDDDFITYNFILKIQEYLSNVLEGKSAYKSITTGVIGKDIIIGKNFTTEDDSLLLKSKGIIVEIGGILSHPAIVAREHKIPCLVSVKNATTLLNKGDKVYLNTKEGYVVKK